MTSKDIARQVYDKMAVKGRAELKSISVDLVDSMPDLQRLANAWDKQGSRVRWRQPDAQHFHIQAELRSREYVRNKERRAMMDWVNDMLGNSD